MEQRLPVRFIRVVRTGRLTPHMVRITFGGPDLADFVLEGPDQQVKLYFPRSGRSAPLLPAVQEADGDVMRWYEAYSAIPEGERPWMRSYTVRAHDPARATIDIDFVLHDDAGGWKSSRPAPERAQRPALRCGRPAAAASEVRRGGGMLPCQRRLADWGHVRSPPSLPGLPS